MSQSAEIEPQPEARIPLSRKRVLSAAVELADREGLSALTMRRLAQELGVEAMSLYHHVANKEAILDGAVEAVLDELHAAAADADLPSGSDDWRAALRARILVARSVMLRHPWAPQVLETRTEMAPAIVAWFDQIVGVLVEGGFTYDLAHHALHALGSRALGFTQELFVPADPTSEDVDAMAAFEQMADQFPYLIGMLAEIVHDDADSTLGWCDGQAEFEFGLDVLLHGLEDRRGRG